ncbi:BamA/TamA family outer membrane protein [Sphingomonas sinipercae]|uniref:BamA/TamA family outer membrane protein n=1 Tax=Sphingomonas sinipercae TaxID=2714944 RepID=A0A6G7ZP61_9SPHN|nr:BamA/TamA family outer membrane protein [Sphingomonas sinipercae]QIL02723.1 BamA/TamA family outer membrane protein [Sphingomonas sinipercae]
MKASGVNGQAAGLRLARTCPSTTMRLLGAAAWLCVPLSPLSAQQAQADPQEAPLDPNAPLDPMTDIGVDWPDLTNLPAEQPRLDAPVVDEPGRQAATILDPNARRQYSIGIEGLDRLSNPDDLVNSFEEQSVLFASRKDEANAAQLQRRSEADAELLTELLHSQGFYDAEVTTRIEPRGAAIAVTLAAEPGERYRFQSVALPGIASAGAEADALRSTYGVRAGDPVVAADVIAAGVDLQVALGERGYALAQVGEREIVIDHETKLATLTIPVTPGPVSQFGEIRVAGDPPFSAHHVAEIARFSSGDRFERDRVDDLRRALVATGLVSTADIKVVPAAANRVDLLVTMQPAPPRTVAGELGYGTGEGLRAEASWQHRNFIRPEGAITVRGIAGTREQLLGVQFRRSNFHRRDRALNLQLAASNTKFDAYRARTVLLAANIERQSNIIWRKKWTWSVGAELLATDERGVFTDPDTKQTRTFLIAALPAELRYDGSDDLLDPTSGFRLGARVSPELSAREGSFTYGRAQLDGSAYRRVRADTVLAGRIRLGTIVGADAAELAPSRRLYSGGGGSVRGYGYQRLGPRDLAGDPVGGRGLAEFSLEARVRRGNFGFVPFLDGGTLTSDILPNVRGWQLGAGLGLRYYSSFGPIRVDVGTPLNRREGDSRIAVTVSLGQAF